MANGLSALAVVIAVASVGSRVDAQAAIDTSRIFVKKAIADRMTSEQLQSYKERLALAQAAGLLDRAPGRLSTPSAPGDLCSSATYEIGPLPYGPVADSTVGATDNYDLPPDVVTPTCLAPTNCVGAGPAGSLPRGAIYSGTGTGPDRAWRLRTNLNCTITIALGPTGGEDLSLFVYQGNCSSSLADCVCVSDTGIANGPEIVSLDAVAGVDYFAVVDGYSTGGTPPGPSGPYTLTVTGTGCKLEPVELQGFTIE